MTLTRRAFVRPLRLFAMGMLLCLALTAAAPARAEAKAKDRVVITGPVLVDRGDTSGDVVVLNGDVLVRGTVDGDLVVVKGNVTLRGRVTGNVITVNDAVTIGTRGRIDGDLRYGNKKPVGASGKVGGKVKRFDPQAIASPAGVFVLGVWLAVTVSIFLLGLILLLLAPRAADAVARSGIGKSLLVGLLAFILLPIVAGIALVTIIGIPLGLVLLLLLLPLYAISYVTGAWAVGRRILKPDKARILSFLVGLVIVRLLALIPIAGGLITFLVTLMGLGALFVALFRARRAPRA